MISHSAARKAGFEIIEPAPSGGSATVYKSRHIPTGEVCALKLPAEDSNADYLQREAGLLGQLNHPSIVRPLHNGFIDSTAYLATHWVDGTQLADVLKRGELVGEQRAVRLFRQIASALHHAHQRGVVHADISPANILIDSKDNVTIVDFGIGQQVDAATVTAGADFTGTLRYVAPEVIKGEKASAASDQYSIAVILYELLTGRWPYDGEATAAAALHSHLYAEPVNVQEHNPTVSSLMDSVLSKSLKKEPLARFNDISVMAGALDGPPDKIPPHVRKTGGLSGSVEKPVILKTLGKVSVVAGVLITLSIVVRAPQESAPVLVSSTILSPSHANAVSDSCNLLNAPAMNSANNVANFYGTDASPENVTLFSSSPNQWQLEIGRSNEYGLYGQIVSVQSEKKYQFSAFIERNGYLHMPALRIEWLDTNYQILPQLLIEYGIREHDDGLIKMPEVEVPENAAYAVPTVYKDETVGTMTISAITFRDISCLENP